MCDWGNHPFPKSEQNLWRRPGKATQLGEDSVMEQGSKNTGRTENKIGQRWRVAGRGGVEAGIANPGT